MDCGTTVSKERPRVPCSGGDSADKPGDCPEAVRFASRIDSFRREARKKSRRPFCPPVRAGEDYLFRGSRISGRFENPKLHALHVRAHPPRHSKVRGDRDAVPVGWCGDADGYAIGFAQEVEVGRCGQPARLHDPAEFIRWNILDIRFTAIHHRGLPLLNVEPDDTETRFGECARERQPHISEAGHGDHRAAVLYLSSSTRTSRKWNRF